MANERDRNTDETDMPGEGFGGTTGNREGNPSREPVSGGSEENIRGTADESDDDEFDDSDDLDDEEEEEGDGTV